MPSVVIDPGHGGKDPGGCGCGLQEKNLVLDIGKRMMPLLQKSGVTAYLTRDQDVFVPISTRYNLANSLNADCFISIHTNAEGSGTAHGFEILWYSERTKVTFGYIMKGHLLEVHNDWRRWVYGDYASVVKKTKMPALLTESLFITNPKEAAMLATPEFRQKLAEAHAEAVCEYLGVKYGGGAEMNPEVKSISIAKDTPEVKIAYVLIEGHDLEKQFTFSMLWPWGKMEEAPATVVSVNSRTNWYAQANTLAVDENGCTIGVVDLGSAKLQVVTLAVYAFPLTV